VSSENMVMASHISVDIGYIFFQLWRQETRHEIFRDVKTKQPLKTKEKIDLLYSCSTYHVTNSGQQ
jgi:hypothetical protein